MAAYGEIPMAAVTIPLKLSSDFDDAVNAGSYFVGSPSTLRDRLLPQMAISRSSG